MESPNDLSLPEDAFTRQTSPFVLPDMQRQVSPGNVTALPMADSDPYPDDYFSKRGVDLPSHLSTKRGRWKSLWIVVIMSAFASGPIASWPTLEPILISEKVFEGPNQEAKLTTVYSLATGIGMISYLFSGIVYDAVGPRATAAGSAFGIVICLVGLALGIQYQSLNWLIWICYPGATVLGYCNNMGGYAWLYLLPDSQNTVSSVTGAIQILSDSLVLLAVLFDHEFGLPLPFYFMLCAFLSVIAGFVCLTFIPDHATSLKVAFVVANPDADAGADQENMHPIPKLKWEWFWDVVTRSVTSLRDCCACFVWYCPGAVLLWYGYECGAYMFAIYPQFVMFPFYQALMGTATATTLVDVFGGVYACFGAVALILFGGFVDRIGFERALLFMNIPMIANFVCYCIPSFWPQVIGQLILSWQGNAWYVFVPRWCLSYAPPELYGSAFGIGGTVLGFFQILGTYLGTLLSSWFDDLVTKNPPPAMPYLTTIALWLIVTVFFSLAYLLFLRYYPMPAPGTVTMADIEMYTTSIKKDEARNFANKLLNKLEDLQPDQRVEKKSSTPTCAPCNCLRPQ